MEVKKQLEKQIINLLQLGWRSRVIKIGFDDTLRELKTGKKGFLILAKDISKRTKRNILYKYDGEYYELFSKEDLGKFLGKKEVGIVFIPDTKFGRKIKETVEKYLEV